MIGGLLTGAVVGATLLVIIAICGVSYAYLDRFSQAAEEPKSVLVARFWGYLHDFNRQPAQPQTFLLLGLDTLVTRDGQPPLTDTMMLVKIWPDKGLITALSLPRDLYLDKMGFKINAIYAAGLERSKKQPEIDARSLVTTEIAGLTNQSIDRTLIFTLDDVSVLVDALGGLPIEVETAFTDEMFPNPDIDVTQVKDPALLYQTVQFDQGMEVMTGQRVLQYIRSRHSSGEEGSDLARNKRQQQVMAALIDRLTDPTIFNSPETLGRLYQIYHQRFESQLPAQIFMQLASSFGQIGQRPQLKKVGISVYPDDPQGLIYHPPERFYNGAWVFVVRDLEKFQQQINQDLQP